jgi:uncharacterized protein YeaO (DUF488 family)
MRRSRINLKRVYDPAEAADGKRVLLDRLWPRGVSKAALKFDLWARDLAPSNALRQWYHRNPDRFAEFQKRYLAELKLNEEQLSDLGDAARSGGLTLLTAAREPERSHCAVLRDALRASR